MSFHARTCGPSGKAAWARPTVLTAGRNAMQGCEPLRAAGRRSEGELGRLQSLPAIAAHLLAMSECREASQAPQMAT